LAVHRDLDEVTEVDVHLGGGLTMGRLALWLLGWLVFPGTS
jgi:hypothetical protein